MRRSVLGLGLLSITCCCASLAHADEVDEAIKTQMERNHIPALVYAVVKDGHVIRSQALGSADLELKKPATQDNLFEIGSLTKQVTAMGVMILLEAGKLQLEDPISKYLPDIPPAWKEVKIRNLLYQNSGLPDYVFVPKLTLIDRFDRNVFMSEMAKLPVDFPPGEAWAYSNTNYALLGWIIEAVASEPYTQFIEENVLRPVGMTHTSFSDGKDLLGLAKGYLRQGITVIPSPRGPASIKSDSGLISTLDDLLKWDEALSGLRLVGRNSYTAMWTRGKLNSGRVKPYGTGWNLSMPFSTPYMGHGGNSAGYSAGISRFPKTRLSVIVLTNIYPLNAESIAKQIAELVEPAVKPTPFNEMVDPDPERTKKVRRAIEALSINRPDPAVMEPEACAPMRTARAKQAGAGPWRQVIFVDEFTLGDVKHQGQDVLLTYQIKSMGKSYLAVVLWSPNNKLAQAQLYGGE